MDKAFINNEWIDTETGEVVEGVLQVPVTLYSNFRDAEGCGTVMLGDFLCTDQYRPKVEQLRDLIRQYGSQEEAKKHREYSSLKKSLPCVTVSGMFQHRRRDAIIAHSGYICLDIDAGDNKSLRTIDRAMQTLMCRPEVAFAAHSCSGNGIFAIVPLANPEYHLQHFWALQQEYGRLGLTLDKSCKDTTRFRAATYDPEPYINEYAIPYETILLEEPQPGVLRPTALIQGTTRQTESNRARYGGARRIYTGPDQWTPEEKMERLVSNIERRGANLCESYDDWYRVGMGLAGAFGEGGYDFFRRISQQSGKFNENDCRRKYNELLRSGTKITVGTVYYRAQQCGVTLTANETANYAN